MEQNHKIQFDAGVRYELTKEELKKFYTYYALSRFSYLRNPNYQEKLVLRMLNTEIIKTVMDIRELIEQMPNNHTLYKILALFERHSNQLSMLKDEFAKQDKVE